MKIFALAGLFAVLVLFAPWPAGANAEELDFGANGGADSGNGEFSRFVPQDGRIMIGKIPVGINDLTINLTAQADLDLELWDGDVFVVGWEADGAKARVHSETEVTASYNGVEITWTGWNGAGGKLGNESITLSGTTKNTFVMKVFGYQTGYVRVAYSWAGGGINGPASSGSGNFSKMVPENGRVTIGTIPSGVDNLLINLTSNKDLDIEIWDGKTFVAGWRVGERKSLIYRSTPVSGLYNGVRIAWSGWDGVNGQKGHEYIRISGTTQNAFLMKVFGYQRGEVHVDYSWGSDTPAAAPKPILNPTPAPTSTPAPTPIPQPTTTPTPQPAAQIVKTWVGGFDVNWSTSLNWSPIGVPNGDELIIIEKGLPLAKLPIIDIDFTLTTGTLTILTVDSVLQVAEGVTFINNGTINADGDLLNKGSMVNNGVYNNGAKIIASGKSATFTNNSGGVLNNSAAGSSSGVITNACGGTVNDSGSLGVVIQAVCLWTGAGGNDNWSNPFNWANDRVPTGSHPVVINGEGAGNAKVVLDIDLVLGSRSLTIGSGDILTIGPGTRAGAVTMAVKEAGGPLINLGTLAISNYSSLTTGPQTTVSNLGGTIRNACRGSAPSGGVIGAIVVQDPCFWDGGGKTDNWSEAANWDSDTVPTSDDPILISVATSTVSGVTLNTSFDISSLGTLTIAAGQTLNVGEGITLRIANQSPGGAIWINGTLNLNGGTLHNQRTGLIRNRGIINVNGGVLNNQGEFLINESGGQINNIGGLISNGAGATFTNQGTLVNDVNASFLQGDQAGLTNSGTFTNAGIFYTSSVGSNFTNLLGGALINSGTIFQSGSGTFSNLAGSRITNSGRINMYASLFDNRGTIENTGTLEVFRSGSFQNQQGLLENRTGGTFSNSGSVTNYSGSTINNAGLIINHRSLLNIGAINNACGGTVAGAVSGNQPVSTCTEG